MKHSAMDRSSHPMPAAMAAMKGTLVMGWEKLHERLVEIGLASEQQVLPQFARFRAAAERCVNVHEYMHVRNCYGIIN